MSSTVQKIGKTTVVGERSSYQSNLKRNYYEKPKQESRDGNDQIDISEEAKSRAKGKHKRNILEHLEES